MSRVETVTIATNELERLTSQAAKYRIEAEELRARVATLEAQRAEARWRVMEELAGAFHSDATMAEEGAAFQGGPLDGASVYNVNARTARKIRELIEAERRAATQEGGGSVGDT